MVHWYQWFDRYQQKMMSFQWFCWLICISFKGTQIIFPCDLAGYRTIPMVHWYQWYNWYQQKMMSFQWFCWLICISFPCDLAGYRTIPMVHWYQWYDWYQQKRTSMQNKFPFTQSKNALIVIMNIPRSVSNHAKHFRSHTRQKRANSYYEYSSFCKLTTQNNFALTQSRNALIVIMNIPRSVS